MSETMKIDKVIAYHFRIPLLRPFQISAGRIEEKHGVILEGRCGDVIGWSEAAVDGIPFYTQETVGTVLELGRSIFGPLVKSKQWKNPQQLCEQMAIYRGHHFAKAAFEVFFWDIYGKKVGKSVANLLGGTREWVEVGISIGIKEKPDEVLREICRALEEGIRRIKIKVTAGKDESVVKEIRREFPDITLMVDANSSYKPCDMERICKWDDYNLLMVEQPFDSQDLYYHSKLAEKMKTPICLDESIETAHLADSAMKMKACDIVNIKVGRVGGLINAVKINDICEKADVAVWIGSRIGTSVGTAMRLAAASLSNASFPSDAGVKKYYISDDIVKEPFEVRNGCEVRVPQAVGMGVDVDRAKLEKYTVNKVEL